MERSSIQRGAEGIYHNSETRSLG